MQTHNYRYLNATPPPRTPSCCSRRTHCASYIGQPGETRKLTDRELQRLLRRIQKPTRAQVLSRSDYSPNKENSSVQVATSRPATASEREKALQQLSRPTTASRAKQVNECYLCHEDEAELNKTPVPFVYLYTDNKTVTVEEVSNIVSRLSSATKASGHASTACYRLPPDFQDMYLQSVRLPLLSGLARTKSVAEIVNRLYGSKESKKNRTFHGYSTTATSTD